MYSRSRPHWPSVKNDIFLLNIGYVIKNKIINTISIFFDLYWWTFQILLALMNWFSIGLRTFISCLLLLRDKPILFSDFIIKSIAWIFWCQYIHFYCLPYGFKKRVGETNIFCICMKIDEYFARPFTVAWEIQTRNIGFGHFIIILAIYVSSRWLHFAIVVCLVLLLLGVESLLMEYSGNVY